MIILKEVLPINLLKKFLCKEKMGIENKLVCLIKRQDNPNLLIFVTYLIGIDLDFLKKLLNRYIKEINAFQRIFSKLLFFLKSMYKDSIR